MDNAVCPAAMEQMDLRNRLPQRTRLATLCAALLAALCIAGDAAGLFTTTSSATTTSTATTSSTVTTTAPPPYPGQLLGITGVFYNLYDTAETLSREPAAATAELAAMKRIGVDTIIVDTAFPPGAFYPSARHPVFPGCSHALDSVVSGAATLGGLKVFLSTPVVADNPLVMAPAERAAALEKVRAMMAELHGRYGASPAFAGWYIAYEISDTMIAMPDARARIAAGYRELASTCRVLSPGCPVIIAPYFAAKLPPDAFETLWTGFLREAGVDVVAVQDSVGALYLCGTPEKRLGILPAYLGALHRACKAAGAQLWADVELFRQVHGEPVDKEPFAGEPADFTRVKRQLEVESPYVSKAVAFCTPHYFSPNALIPRVARRARALYDAYAHWMQESRRQH